VDPEGFIYILDLVNRRVQIFSPQGDFLRETACGILGHDLSLDENGALYLLAPYHGLIEKYDSGGNLSARWPISPQIWLIDGMRNVDGQVILRTVLQTEYTIAGAKGALQPQQQLSHVRQGFGGRNPARRYQTQWEDDHLGLLRYLDGDGKKIREIQVATHGVLGSLVFLGTDSGDNVYLRAEILGPEEEAGQQILKFDPQGSMLAEFPIPASDYTFVYRNLYLDCDGDIYQLLTGPDGVRVLRWTAAIEAGEGR
jgi:hypothetical protein